MMEDNEKNKQFIYFFVLKSSFVGNAVSPSPHKDTSTFINSAILPKETAVYAFRAISRIHYAIDKIEHNSLDFIVKMGYYVTMLSEKILFILRLLLIAAVWAFVWRLIQPKTQAMRILRAALLILALLTVLAVTRVTGY
jgi:hypothetical protein